jgi:peptidoglycan biosynthesis protein MviN/MurJ (putative lipid II flippase)
MAAGIHPLVNLVFGRLTDSEAVLLTSTIRIYLITLCGYSIHEVAVRAFYARKEAIYPLLGVIIRLIIYLTIGISAITFFKEIGAPAIALAEISLTIEAIILYIWLSRRTHEPLVVWSAVGKGVVAALVGGVTAYGLAVIVPGSAVLTALLGMVIGGLICLPIIWSEIKLLLKL